MYGMTASGGYATQYSRSLEKDVSKQKTSVGDYYARKAEMLKILMTDCDSGESCTRGNNRPFAGPGHVTYPSLNLRPGTL